MILGQPLNHHISCSKVFYKHRVISCDVLLLFEAEKPHSKSFLLKKHLRSGSSLNTLLKHWILVTTLLFTSILGGKVCVVFTSGSILHPNPKNSQRKHFYSLPWPMIKRLDIVFLEVGVISGTLHGTNISHLRKRKIIFTSALVTGYLSLQEGRCMEFMECLWINYYVDIYFTIPSFAKHSKSLMYGMFLKLLGICSVQRFGFRCLGWSDGKWFPSAISAIMVLSLVTYDLLVRSTQRLQ